MILDQKVLISAPPERVWELMMDVPSVATCVPGVETVERVSDDEYIGALRVRVGKISVRLEGKVTVVDRDKDSWRAGLNVEAADRKIRGSVKAKSSMQLNPQSNGSTELTVHADASILGKLGEFGQAVMRRKADQIVGEFARNVAERIGPGSNEDPQVTPAGAVAGAGAGDTGSADAMRAGEAAGTLPPSRWKAFVAWLRRWLRMIARRG